MSSENDPARINRYLEEGAEEFLLKRVRLSDLNKLKSHMMKTKLKNQELVEIEKPSKVENGAATVVAAVEPEIKDPTQIEIEILPPLQQDMKLVVQQEEQTLSTNNNKRKSMEEGISKDRSRPTFDAITTVV